jgi:hypothetical protein
MRKGTVEKSFRDCLGPSFFFREYVIENETGLEIRCDLNTYSKSMRDADDLLHKSLIVMRTALVMANNQLKERSLQRLWLHARVRSCHGA